jgi:hypothetical protein
VVRILSAFFPSQITMIVAAAKTHTVH